MIPQPARAIQVGPFIAGSVATLAELSQQATEMFPDGARVWVTSLACYWSLRTTNAPNQALQRVSTTIATRKWEREPTSDVSNPWLSQLNWMVSPTGNDEAAGTSAAPLATFDEWVRRIGFAQLNDGYTVQSSGPLGNLTAVLNMGENGRLFIDMSPAATQVGAGAVTGWAAPNPAGPEWAVLTDAAQVFVPFLHRRIRIVNSVNPASIGAVCFNVGAPPGPPTNARVSLPTRVIGAAAANPFGAPVVPAVGDAYVIEQLAACGNINITVNKSCPNVANVNSVVIGSAAVAAGAANSGRVYFNTPLANPGALYGCDLDAFELTLSGTVVGSLIRARGAGVIAQGIYPQGVANGVTSGVINRSAFMDSPFTTALAILATNFEAEPPLGGWDATLFPMQGFTLLSGGTFFNGNIAGNAIDISQVGAILESTDLVYGTCGGYGVRINRPGGLYGYGNAGIKPTVAGTLADTRFGGVNRAWAAIPLYDAVAAQGILANV